MRVTPEQKASILIAAQADDLARDRINYDYASELLKNVGNEPYDLWPQPNETIRAIIEGEVEFEELILDDDNIDRKSYYLEEQAEFVEAHQDLPALCEALGLSACRGSDCLFYVPTTNTRHGIGLCREYKLSFRKPEASTDPLELIVPDEENEEELSVDDPLVVALFHGKLRKFQSQEIASLARPIEIIIGWINAGRPEGVMSETSVSEAVDAIIELERIYETRLLPACRGNIQPGTDADYVEGRLSYIHLSFDD